MKNLKITYINGLLLFSLLAFFSCKKEVITKKTEENVVQYAVDTVVISGNIAPADTSISQLLVDNYISRVYIALIGRKPSALELSEIQSIVSYQKFSVADRKNLINKVLLNKTEYYTKTYNEASKKLIQNADSTTVNEQIFVMQFILSNGAMEAYWDYAQYELDRLLEMQQVYDDYINDNSSIFDVHRTLISNNIYDDINMGSENFVTSTFLNFFNRYPTNSELSEGVMMVDGFSGVLFYHTGHTKEDYIQIFFDSQNYFEGQINDLYYTYLLRNANISELALLTKKYMDEKNYENIIVEILSSNEFAGIK